MAGRKRVYGWVGSCKNCGADASYSSSKPENLCERCGNSIVPPAKEGGPRTVLLDGVLYKLIEVGQ